METAAYPLLSCPDPSQSGPAALASVARYHGLPLSLTQLAALTRDAGDSFDLTWMVIAPRLIGFESLALSGEYDQLTDVERPTLLLLRGAGGRERFVVLYEIDPDAAVIGDPAGGQIERISRAQLLVEWTGDCISLTPEPAALAQARARLASLGDPWSWLREAFAPTQAGWRKRAFLAALLAVVGVISSARGQGLAGWGGLFALGLAALSSFWLALLGRACVSCSAATRIAGVLPLAHLGAAFYTVTLALAAWSGHGPLLLAALFCASGVHGALLWSLARARVVCSGCLLAAAGVFLAAAAFSLAARGVGAVEVFGALACAAATFAALPLSRRLAALLGDRAARDLALTVAAPPAGRVRVVVWKRRGCTPCLYYEAILRPALREELGDELLLEEKEAEAPWLPTPLIVVSGALTILFKGLPPGDEDRYAALSQAVQLAREPRLASLGELRGLFLVG
jgi:hypothetical protein